MGPSVKLSDTRLNYCFIGAGETAMFRNVSVLLSGAFEVKMNSHNELSLMYSSCLATNLQSSLSLCAFASADSCSTLFFVKACTCMLSCQGALKNGLKSVAAQDPTISTMAKTNGRIHLLGLTEKRI